MSWRKSSYSGMNANCLEAANWRKASYSGNSMNCVETATVPAVVLVRDTTDRGGPMLAFSAGMWAAFTQALKEQGRVPAS